MKKVYKTVQLYLIHHNAMQTDYPTGTTLRKIIGDPNPDYTASLVNEFTYKKLSLSIQLDAVQGVDVFNADFRTSQGVGNGTVAQRKTWDMYPRGLYSWHLSN